MKSSFLLLILISCTHLNQKKEQISRWHGLSQKEILEDPFFSKLKLKRTRSDNGDLVLKLSDGSPALTKARCEGLGGCLGFSENWCDHIFTIQKDKIIRYQQIGPCPSINQQPQDQQ
jgi:hypothetical protein